MKNIFGRGDEPGPWRRLAQTAWVYIVLVASLIMLFWLAGQPDY